MKEKIVVEEDGLANSSSDQQLEIARNDKFHAKLLYVVAVIFAGAGMYTAIAYRDTEASLGSIMIAAVAGMLGWYGVSKANKRAEQPKD